MNSGWCKDCDCKLNIESVCAKHIRACKIKVKDLDLEDQLCAPLVSSPSVCAGQVTANQADLNSACVGNLNAPQACVQNLNATSAGIGSLVANDLCVPGRLNAANLLSCGKYQATVVYSAPTTYTLGNFLNFDVVLDDPNGNVSLGPTTYTAPHAGYYSFTYKVNITNLQPSIGPILGAPVANPEVYVNGSLAREAYAPWLTFNNVQKTLVSSLISLKAGDQVTMKYRVLAIDAVLGLVDVAGTVDIFGNGVEDGNSLFKIILLSVDCPSLPCAPSNSCTPCTPMQCTPCMPCERPKNCGCDSDDMSNQAGSSHDAEMAAIMAKAKLARAQRA